MEQNGCAFALSDSLDSCPVSWYGVTFLRRNDGGRYFESMVALTRHAVVVRYGIVTGQLGEICEEVYIGNDQDRLLERERDQGGT